MTVLSDKDILKYMEREEDPLVIKPFAKSLLTPNGMDILLSNRGEMFFPIKHGESVNLLELRYKNETLDVEYGKPFVLNKDERLRIETYQYFKLPRDLTGHLFPRTKYEHRAPVGIKASGVVDAGYEGTLSVTLIHDGNFSESLQIYPLMRVAQIQFHMLYTSCEFDYNERGGSYGRKDKGIIHQANLDPEKEREFIINGNVEGLFEYYRTLDKKLK